MVKSSCAVPAAAPSARRDCLYLPAPAAAKAGNSDKEYVVKPFHYPELRARIGAVLRRRDERRDGPLRVGELVVDPARRRTWLGQRPIELSAKEFSLLRVLAADPHRVFTKRELLGQVWGYRTPAKTRTLDSHASRLRRKLDPDDGRFVINCWGVGYRLLDG